MALTDAYTFQLDGGPILNDDVSIPFVDITRVSGLDSAPFRETFRDHEGTDGSFMDAEFEQGRPIILEGIVYADKNAMETYLDTLKSNFAPRKELVQFNTRADSGGERLLFVKPLGCRYNWSTRRRIATAEIQFAMFAEDPRIYDATQTIVTISFGTAATTGFGFDLDFDFGFGAGGGGNDGEFVNNEGNRPTPPIFTINGPVNDPVIRDETYNHVLQFNINLSASEFLEIDTQYRTVRLNGVTNRRNTLFTPDWFFLEPGQTFIRYGGVNGTGSTLDVTFRSAWR